MNPDIRPLSHDVETIDDTSKSEAISPVDPSKFTMTVAEALIEFLDQGCSTTERTIQRYCQSGKLNALRVDPDTREITDKDPYLFLIDPASVAKRISIAKEQQEFSRPTVVATRHDVSRPVETAPDVDASLTDNDGSTSTTSKDAEVSELKQQVQALTIDKKVRDKMLEQMTNDRKQILHQIEGYVKMIAAANRELGAAENRLEMLALVPAAEQEGLTTDTQTIADQFSPTFKNTQQNQTNFGV